MKGKTLSWNDRLTLINHFKPTDTEISRVFNVSQGELDVARGQLKTGVFSLQNDLDVDSYAYLFATTSVVDGDSSATSIKATTTKGGSTSIAKPESATAKAHAPKKRGRKGDKITKAFSSIPASPIAADDFAKEHGVSIAVLRQSKRFDSVGGGVVRVKKDKGSKTLMIWREEA